MYLLIGLGNPGSSYENTRHNAGFLLLDALQKKYGLPAFMEDKKFSALLSRGTLFGSPVILVKPTTFMNLSGKSVQALMSFYKIAPENIIVIHDDVDIASGTLRTTSSSRAAGNNGVQNIIDTLGTQDFFRIRLGVGRPTETLGVCMPIHDYVLKDFRPDEQEAQNLLLPEAESAIEKFLKETA